MSRRLGCCLFFAQDAPGFLSALEATESRGAAWSHGTSRGADHNLPGDMASLLCCDRVLCLLVKLILQPEDLFFLFDRFDHLGQLLHPVAQTKLAQQ